MITSAEEFIFLRKSELFEEYNRSANEEADISVWMEVINHYPEFKQWVAHNKTIQIEILELLAKDNDPKVRSVVARKRKINDFIFNLLSQDTDEGVRYTLMCNTKLSFSKKRLIKTDDSTWLAEKLNEITAANT